MSFLRFIGRIELEFETWLNKNFTTSIGRKLFEALNERSRA